MPKSQTHFSVGGDGFPELKSQEEIDHEQTWNWFKWYFVFSAGVSIIICILMIAALVKYVFF